MRPNLNIKCYFGTALALRGIWAISSMLLLANLRSRRPDLPSSNSALAPPNSDDVVGESATTPCRLIVPSDTRSWPAAAHSAPERSLILLLLLLHRRGEARRSRREPRPAGSVHHLSGAEAHAAERHHRTHEALQASVARVLNIE